MTPDDHYDDDRQPGPGDADNPTRDARGRWRPGYCPNTKGRPRKKPKTIIHEADIQIFGNTLIDVVANGQQEEMIRRSALFNRIFESAMKGSVTQQRFLYHEFERNDKRLAAARVHYDRLLFNWVLNNTVPGQRRVEIPLEVEVEMDSLRVLLNHYYPDSYPLYGVSVNDDDDDYLAPGAAHRVLADLAPNRPASAACASSATTASMKARTRKRIASSRGSNQFSPENGLGDVDAVRCFMA